MAHGTLRAPPPVHTLWPHIDRAVTRFVATDCDLGVRVVSPRVGEMMRSPHWTVASLTESSAKAGVGRWGESQGAGHGV